MKSYGFTGSFLNLKYRTSNFLKANSVKIIVLTFVAILALITGVFSAVKYLKGDIEIVFSDFGLREFVSGNSGSSTMFFQRFGSISVVMIFLTVFSLHSALFPLGGVIIVYRTFLIGLNITFIVITYGLGGIITGLLIILPLQLLMLAIMIIFFVMSRDRCVIKTKYKIKKGLNIFWLFVIFLLLLTVINIIETFLLFLTSAKVILVI